MKIKRDNPPQPEGKISFNLPKLNKSVLNNGIEVTFVHKTNLPILQMNLLINGGSKYDPINRGGLAHLTSLLIDEGAGKYNSLQLDEEFESLGSIFNVSTDSDNILLSLLSLEENFERSLELFSLVYQTPNFTNADFDREQKKLIAKIMQNQAEPSYVAATNFDKIIFKDTYYQNSILGSTGEVNSITNSDVKEFYKKYFAPTNTQMVVVGNISFDKLLLLLNKYFIEGNKNKLDEVSKVTPLKQKSNLYFIHKDGAAQSEIKIGHISDKRDETNYYATLIANSILGGQFSSRLNLNLREDKGFTYGINSAFSYHTNAGHFEIATSVNGKDTGAAIKEIVKEIKGIKEEITQNEIEFTKSYLIKRFPSMFETYSQIARNLLSLIKHKLSDNYFDNYIEKITSSSKNEIERIIKEKIKINELIYLVVGERETVLPQLKEIKDLEIIELNVDGEIISD